MKKELVLYIQNARLCLAINRFNVPQLCLTGKLLLKNRKFLQKKKLLTVTKV